MRNSIIAFVIVLITFGIVTCRNNESNMQKTVSVEQELTKITNEFYELYKPSTEIESVLILFGGYPEKIVDIKNEFKILKGANEHGIAVIFINYNQKLWLNNKDKRYLAEKLQDIFESNNLSTDNIYIGGFSSGGTISLLISNYIVGMKEFYIDPTGVFIIDSPVDLMELYATAEENIQNQFSEVSVQEGKFLIDVLENNIGDPKYNIQNYENKSVYTFKSKNISNLKRLKHTDIRLYTEPDTIWWKENRMNNYRRTNAYYIEMLAEDLIEEGFTNVEYIPTMNKGYRANGVRHPHSWSIVDQENLIEWMLRD